VFILPLLFLVLPILSYFSESPGYSKLASIHQKKSHNYPRWTTKRKIKYWVKSDFKKSLKKTPLRKVESWIEAEKINFLKKTCFEKRQHNEYLSRKYPKSQKSDPVECKKYRDLISRK
jgi:hypothetical protein